MTLNGFDINGKKGSEAGILDRISNEADFVIFKATEGKGWKDPLTPGYAARFRSEGIPLGWYHYAWPNNPVDAEIENFLSHAQPLKGETLWLDFEPYGQGTDPTTWAPWVHEFLVKASDLTDANVGIYLNNDIGTQVMRYATDSQKERILKAPLWKAAYSLTNYGNLLGWPNYSIWQWNADWIDKNRIEDHSLWDRICIPKDEPPPPPGDKVKVYLDKLHYGQRDSDSVKALQEALNAHSLPAPGNITLPVTGNYLDKTSTVVVTCQKVHGFGNDPLNASFVGQRQAEHLFAGRDVEIIGSTPPPPPPPPPPGNINTPFPGARVTTGYKVPGRHWAAGYHTGVDYACGVGTDLRSTWTSVVVATNAWGSAYGNHVIMEHAGIRIAYCHMSSIAVRVGQHLVPGTHVGKSGNTGNTTGPHLHVEARTAPYRYNNVIQFPTL